MGIIDTEGGLCRWMFRCRQRYERDLSRRGSYEPVIVIQGGVIRLRRRGHQRVRRQRVCVRTEPWMWWHQAGRRKPVEITAKVETGDDQSLRAEVISPAAPLNEAERVALY